MKNNRRILNSIISYGICIVMIFAGIPIKADAAEDAHSNNDFKPVILKILAKEAIADVSGIQSLKDYQKSTNEYYDRLISAAVNDTSKQKLQESKDIFNKTYEEKINAMRKVRDRNRGFFRNMINFVKRMGQTISRSLGRGLKWTGNIAISGVKETVNSVISQLSSDPGKLLQQVIIVGLTGGTDAIKKIPEKILARALQKAEKTAEGKILAEIAGAAGIDINSDEESEKSDEDFQDKPPEEGEPGYEGEGGYDDEENVSDDEEIDYNDNPPEEGEPGYEGESGYDDENNSNSTDIADDGMEGTYSCSFWLASYETIPFKNFTADPWYTAEQKVEMAKKSAESSVEAWQKKIGEVTQDRENFRLTVNEDGTCNISFSDFLGFNSVYQAGRNIPWNGGNVTWEEQKGTTEYKISVSFNSSEDKTSMKGNISRKSRENMYYATWRYEFEGEKVR